MADRRLPEVHPNFEPVLAAFAGDEGITFGKMLVSSGLKVNGKFFAFSKQGNMVVKEWLVVPPGALDWAALAREAHAFVSLGGR
jgi:hypothetical protein